MKRYAIIAGLVLGFATLAVTHAIGPVHQSGPVPLCPPSQPNCGLN